MRRLVVASLWLILPAAVLVAGAQKTSDLMVTLKFFPQESVRSNSVALPASLIDRASEIRVEDSRESTDAQVIGTGTDDDDRPFPIRATSDVAKFVDDSVAQLATAHSLKKGSPAERVLNVRLTRFNVNESNKALGSTYNAEVHFAYTLLDGEGKPLTEGAAAGVANRYGRARSGENCAEVLSDALKDAFTKTMSDAALQKAWTSGQPMASGAKPAAGQPAGPTGTVEERLKRLDDLLKKGVITKEEHAARRAAILKEI
jgi:hypothetical protein